MSVKLPGYKGAALEALKKAGADIGDTLQVLRGDEEYEGMLIPRSESSDDKHIVIKLKNGYNVGVRITQETQIKKIGSGAKPEFSKPQLPPQRPNLPRVAILSTGGTIASRVDYRTGGVRPTLTAHDLYSVVPELSDIAIIETEILFSIFSENITPQHWTQTAKRISSIIKTGVAGVVVAHGTDTMGYTAAALSFALQNLPVPVVVVGSQRSADRPSSDAATNLIGAVMAASHAPFAEVVVAMHNTVSDKTIVFHRGTVVRKCHTSRRDAFISKNMPPLAEFDQSSIRMLTKSYTKRDTHRKLAVKPFFDEKVAMAKFYPGMDANALDWYVDNGFKGLVLEGTGLGHVSSKCFPALKRAIEKNVIVVMTSQCIWGRVNMNVYDTGRDLLELGVIPLEDILPETALVKLMWVLGQTTDIDEAKKLVVKNIANEFSDRTALENSSGGR